MRRRPVAHGGHYARRDRVRPALDVADDDEAPDTDARLQPVGDGVAHLMPVPG